MPSGVQAQDKGVQLSDQSFHAKTRAARRLGGGKAPPLPGCPRRHFLIESGIDTGWPNLQMFIAAVQG